MLIGAGQVRARNKNISGLRGNPSAGSEDNVGDSLNSCISVREMNFNCFEYNRVNTKDSLHVVLSNEDF